MKYIKVLFILISTLIGFLFSLPTQANSNKNIIVLQLPWKHQFQFAGYYAAIEKGFYKDEGLEVEIRQADVGTNPVDDILSGESHFSVGNSELIQYYMEGKPIVVLACIMQHSPSILISKSVSNLSKPTDFIGKRIMLNETSSGVDILAMLYRAGIMRSQFEIVESSLSLNDLLSGRVDAYHGYLSNEPFFMDKFGIPYSVMNPADFGINFYSDCLFTSQQLVFNNPSMVEKFRKASLRGWTYALRNKEELVNTILSKYNPSKTYDHLLYEARVIERLINPELIEIGHTNSERWFRTAEMLYQLGLIKQIRSIDDFIFKPTTTFYGTWYKLSFLGLATILVILLFFMFRNFFSFKVRKRLRTLAALGKEIGIKQEELTQLQMRHSILNLSNLELEGSNNEIANNLSEELTTIANEIEASIVKLNYSLGKANEEDTIFEPLVSIKNRIIKKNKDLLLYARIAELRPNQFKQISLEDLIGDFTEGIKQQYVLSSNDVRVETLVAFKKYLFEADKLLLFLKSFVGFLYGFERPESLVIKAIQEDDRTLEIILNAKFGIISQGLSHQITGLLSPNQYLPKQNMSFLASVKLLRQRNDSIWIDTNGSTDVIIRFRLPCLVLEDVNIMGYNTPPMQTGLTLATIMRLNSKLIGIADNDHEGYGLIKTMLVGCGCTIFHMQNVDIAIGAIENLSSIDTLILSIDSYSNDIDISIDRIREYNANLPILLLVGVDASGLQPNNALNKKFSILQKPFSQAQIIHAISEAINRKVGRRD